MVGSRGCFATLRRHRVGRQETTGSQRVFDETCAGWLWDADACVNPSGAREEVWAVDTSSASSAYK